MNFIFYLIILITFFPNIALSNPKATKGTINLSDFNLKKEKKIALSGQWRFYWKQILNPKDILNGKIPTNPDYIWYMANKRQKFNFKKQQSNTTVTPIFLSLANKLRFKLVDNKLVNSGKLKRLSVKGRCERI